MLKWLVGQVSVFVFERARRNTAGSRVFKLEDRSVLADFTSGWREKKEIMECWNIGMVGTNNLRGELFLL